jgi:hypothetical protein
VPDVVPLELEVVPPVVVPVVVPEVEEPDELKPVPELEFVVVPELEPVAVPELELLPVPVVVPPVVPDVVALELVPEPPPSLTAGWQIPTSGSHERPLLQVRFG